MWSRNGQPSGWPFLLPGGLEAARASQLSLQTSVPHPFRVFQRNGWDTGKIPVCTISEKSLIGSVGLGYGADGLRGSKYLIR